MTKRKPQRLSLALACVVGLASGCSMLSPDAGTNLNALPLKQATASSSAIGVADPLAKNTKADKRLAKPVDASQSAQACLVTARAFKEKGFTGDAIMMFERARKHQPDLQGISRDLAVLYDRAGEYFQADREYQAALAVSPDDPDLLNDYGFFHYQRSRYDDAELQFREAIKRKPNHERALTNLGMTLAKKNQWDESESLFAIVSGPAAAAFNVAVMRAAIGDSSIALQKCEQALTLQPTLEPAQALSTKLARDVSVRMAANAALTPANSFGVQP